MIVFPEIFKSSEEEMNNSFSIAGYWIGDKYNF